jgi:peptidoglycan hydrolase FlgJ
MTSPFSLNTILTPGTTSPGSSPKDDPEKIKNAAEQFEALMIEQMLQSAANSGSGGWMGSSDDDSDSALGGVAEQSFAQALSANGGLGLAKLIVAGLSRKAGAGDAAGSGGS